MTDPNTVITAAQIVVAIRDSNIPVEKVSFSDGGFSVTVSGGKVTNLKQPGTHGIDIGEKSLDINGIDIGEKDVEPEG